MSSDTYQKFGARTGTRPPDDPEAPASASTALRQAAASYRTARAAWLDAEAEHARITSDEAARAARDADAEAERQRAAAGDYADPTDTAAQRLEADQRAAVRRVTAAQDRLAEALHHLEAACGSADVAAPVAEAVRDEGGPGASPLSSAHSRTSWTPPWSRTTTPPASSLRGVTGCRTCRARSAPPAPSPSPWPHWLRHWGETPRLGRPGRSTTTSTRAPMGAPLRVRLGRQCARAGGTRPGPAPSAPRGSTGERDSPTTARAARSDPRPPVRHGRRLRATCNLPCATHHRTATDPRCGRRPGDRDETHARASARTQHASEQSDVANDERQARTTDSDTVGRLCQEASHLGGVPDHLAPLDRRRGRSHRKHCTPWLSTGRTHCEYERHRSDAR